ncbi:MULTISPECIES: hypothetical protein [Mesorhizobium]|uniref:Uncharacterized protein n=1 Tax=Mesorhizobium japonicum R7A TaxID=935547 RepID=A0ABX6MUF7_9HYPH|nr:MULTISPECIES: hypothetical protein [Mesorhizobium]MBE1711498.1 hypothetical protein [Mesorhizobium japonicum]MBE1716316.1 hypothetical protein [Mesorhizobium japonicum]MUT24120.1 hypothetical protein [Mesorhizobium japonicum]MUT30911.1 hypothetical protein [Mesorhizobium japonicum]QJF02659.1 hypothetical protein R7A2020_17850 [Mesorhizobium japonicum R7A]
MAASPTPILQRWILAKIANDGVFLPVTIRGVEERTKSQLLGFSSDERPAGQ